MSDKIKTENWRKSFIDAVIISASLVVIVLSCFYHSMLFQLNEELVTDGISHLMSIVSIIAALASLALGVVYKRIAVPIFYSILFGVCFISYFIIAIKGTTEVFISSVANMILLSLTFPQTAYDSLFYNQTALPTLIITGIIFLLAVVSAVAVGALNKKTK